MSVPDRSDRRAFELYRHSVELANLDGKALERLCRDIISPEWVAREGISKGTPLDWTRYDYRLAPEAPAVTPFTFENGPVTLKVRSRDDGTLAVAHINPNGYAVFYSSESGDWTQESFADFDNYFEQLDGTPCGIVQPSAEPEWRFYVHRDEDILVRLKDGVSESRWLTHPDEFRVDVFATGALTHRGYTEIPAAEAEALIQKARAK